MTRLAVYPFSWQGKCVFVHKSSLHVTKRMRQPMVPVRWISLLDSKQMVTSDSLHICYVNLLIFIVSKPRFVLFLATHVIFGLMTFECFFVMWTFCVVHVTKFRFVSHISFHILIPLYLFQKHLLKNYEARFYLDFLETSATFLNSSGFESLLTDK
jgi:hypothetical protein